MNGGGIYDESGSVYDEFGVSKPRKSDATPILYDGLKTRRISRRRESPPFPKELQAAIEAFEAVHDDPSALRGRSPKSALDSWLKKHKPELSKGARERISTISNWRPGGGAPQTPGN